MPPTGVLNGSVVKSMVSIVCVNDKRNTEHPHSKKLKQTRIYVSIQRRRLMSVRVSALYGFIFSSSSRSVKGLHVNMIITNRNFKTLISLILGPYLPSLVGFTREDVRRLFPFFEKNVWQMLRESGYMHIQATKPDTVGGDMHSRSLPVDFSIQSCHKSCTKGLLMLITTVCTGCGVNDSPVGLAAYILEKFSTWTHTKYTDLDDGGLDRCKEFGRSHLKRSFLHTLVVNIKNLILTGSTPWMTFWPTSWYIGPRAPLSLPCASTRRIWVATLTKGWMQGMWPIDSLIRSNYYTFPKITLHLSPPLAALVSLYPPALLPSQKSSYTVQGLGQTQSITTSTPTRWCLEVVTLLPLRNPSCWLKTSSSLSERLRSAERAKTCRDMVGSLLVILKHLENPCFNVSKDNWWMMLTYT